MARGPASIAALTGGLGCAVGPSMPRAFSGCEVVASS